MNTDILKLFSTALAVFIACSAGAQDMRLFLLVGQSNMAGRGRNYQNDNADNPAIVKLDKDGNWVSATEPVHFDKRAAGAGLSTSFAREYIKSNPGEKVGLIPCAVGGTGIRRWVPGGDLFKKAVERARIAEKDGQIIGILWHQGEHDASAKERADIYERQLTAVVEGFRKELGSQVTFVAGGLGEYLPNHRNKQGEPDIPYSKEVTAATRRVMERLPRCGFASSEGITETIGDTLHFSTSSLREFGRRYYAVWSALANTTIGKYRSRDYELLVDGTPVEVIATPRRENWKKPGVGLRVSAEGSYSYAAFTINAEAAVEVKSGVFDLTKAVVLPEGKAPPLKRVAPDRLQFRMRPGQQLVVEPNGRHRALILAANPVRENAPTCGGGKLRYFGPGYHRPGFVELGDGESVYLAEGAWVEGLIYARGRDITISGPGVISGAPYNWQVGPYKTRSELGVTDQGAVITMCGENLTIRDTTICSGWVYNLAFNEATNVVVDNVKIISGRNINDDGIDPCRTKNIVIRNCLVHTQDDCIAPKYWIDRMLVENCILWNDKANSVRIGFECEDGRTGLKHRDITMRDIDILHTTEVNKGLTNFWARAVLTVEAAKDQVFESILFEDIRVHDCPEDWVFVDVRTRDIKAGGLPYCRTDRAGTIDGLVFRNIHLKKNGRGMQVGFSAHDDAHPIRNARFENVTGYGEVVTRGNVDFLVDSTLGK